MKLTKSQIKAAQAWAKEMIDELTPLQPADDKPWTAFEVGEYHEAGLQVVRGEERKRLNALFDAAGREAGLVEFLNS